MTSENAYHLNDRTLKYMLMAQAARNHEYLGLPGEHIASYPTEYVLPNMETGRADDLHSSTANMLINIEEESGIVSEKTLEKISKYRIFGDFMYPMGTYTAIVCLKNPKNFPKEYEITPTNILRPNYIYFSSDQLWMKYENLINKIKQKEQLSDMEALDMAFIPKYISQKHRAFVTEKLVRLYPESIIGDDKLKLDVGTILGGMILKNIPTKKQNQLMDELGMIKIETDLDRLVYEEYGDKLDKVQKELEELKITTKNTTKNKDKEIQNLKNTTKNKDKEIQNLKNTTKDIITNILETTDDPQIQEKLTSLLTIL